MPKMNRKREQDRRDVDDFRAQHTDDKFTLSVSTVGSYQLKMWAMELFCFPKKFTIVNPFLILVDCFSAEDLERVLLLFGQNGAIFRIYSHRNNFQDKRKWQTSS